MRRILKAEGRRGGGRDEWGLVGKKGKVPSSPFLTGRIPLVSRSLFRSSSGTESLEQANSSQDVFWRLTYRNAPEGSTMTRQGRLARFIYRGIFFDSQSNADSPNTEKFEGGLVYSSHSFPQPHTGHLPDCLHLIHTIPPTSVQNHMKQ